LKCYVHRDVDAIGVCSECGQGICDSCAVRIAGKLYCKTDVDRVFSRLLEKKIQKPTQPERSTRVMVSSILLLIYGVVGIGLSVLFIIAGFTAGFFAGFGGLPSQIVAATSIGLLVLGGLILFMGILGIVCGWWLWRGKLWGVMAGIPLLLLGIVIVTIFASIYPSLTTDELAGAIWIGNGLMMVLLFASWSSLAADT
jgi:hypothetical protein